MASMALSAFAAAPALAIKVGEPNDKGEVKVDVILKNAAALSPAVSILSLTLTLTPSLSQQLA